MSETLSEKRRRAGRLGAAARWAGKPGTTASQPRPSGYTEALKAWRAGRPKDALSYEIRNQSGSSGPAEMWIYDEIDTWWGISAQAVIDELRGITADRITLHINSPGGDVFEAHAIYNALREHQAGVDVVVDGLAASAASYIAMAGDSITMSLNAIMMIHDAIGITLGNAADHTDTAGRLDKISNGIAALYADRAGGTRDEWRDAMRAETWYDADEAVEAGLADSVKGHDEGGDVNARVDTATFAAAAKLTPTSNGTPGPDAPAEGQPAGDGIDVAALTEALEGAFA
jgi:ATP-dependent protease ClpP protease subunit